MILFCAVPCICWLHRHLPVQDLPAQDLPSLRSHVKSSERQKVQMPRETPLESKLVCRQAHSGSPAPVRPVLYTARCIPSVSRYATAASEQSQACCMKDAQDLRCKGGQRNLPHSRVQEFVQSERVDARRAKLAGTQARVHASKHGREMQVTLQASTHARMQARVTKSIDQFQPLFLAILSSYKKLSPYHFGRPSKTQVDFRGTRGSRSSPHPLQTMSALEQPNYMPAIWPPPPPAD